MGEKKKLFFFALYYYILKIIYYICIMKIAITIKKIEFMEALKQKLQDLQEALKNKSITVNEYSSMYYSTYQQIKALRK